MVDSCFEINKMNFPKSSKVLVRVDFNVPIDNNTVLDNSRILLCIPTIKLLLENNNAVILISHLGRPKGFQKKLSMGIVKNHLKMIPFFKQKKNSFL